MNEKTVWISHRQWETIQFWIERQNIKNHCRSLSAVSMTAHDLILEVGEKEMLVRADWKKELKKRYLVPPPVDGIHIGKYAADIARHKSKYGHCEWVLWTGKDGQACSAKLTADTIKAAMLATGTQGKFTIYYPDGIPVCGYWWLGCNIIRQIKLGYF